MPASMGDQSADRVMPSMLPSPPMSAAWGTSGGNIWATATSDTLHPMGPVEPDPRSWYYAPAPVDDPQPALVPRPKQPSQRGLYQPPQQSAHQQAVGLLPVREKAKPAQPAPVRVLIQRLSPTTSVVEIRLMLVFSQELFDVELISPDHSKGETHGSAVLYFRSLDGASEARNKLDGRPNPSGSGTMKVSIMAHPANGSPAYGSPAYGSPTRASSTVPNGAPNGFPDFVYYNNSPQPPLSNGLVSPTAQPGRFFPGPGPGHPSGHAAAAAAAAAAAPHHQDLASPNSQAGSHYKEMFNRQPPVGNYLPNEVPGQLGKHLINDELGDEDDRELLRDTVAYGSRDTPVQRRNASMTPPDSVNQAMASLSLDPSISLKTGPMPAYVAGMPAVVGVNNIYMRLEQHFRRQQQQFHLQQNQSDRPDKRSSRHASRQQQALYGGSNYPPVNPADQNPPCNTLYVGNLPMNACEEELKILFSLTRGYKRLCFRTKHNGPMCFVEYEDIAHATKTLTALYGFPLHNSVKGGIRLSFSKNPLGVRSASSQPPHGNLYPGGGMRTQASNGFAAASGPPPGLPRPPDVGSRPHSNFGAGSRSGSAMGAPPNGSVNGNRSGNGNGNRNGSVHGQRNGNVHGHRNGSVGGGGSEAGSNYAQRAPYYRNGANGTDGLNGVYNMNGTHGMPSMNGMNGMHNMNGLNGINGLIMAKPSTPVV